jgi:hypothetical protein
MANANMVRAKTQACTRIDFRQSLVSGKVGAAEALFMGVRPFWSGMIGAVVGDRFVSQKISMTIGRSLGEVLKRKK